MSRSLSDFITMSKVALSAATLASYVSRVALTSFGTAGTAVVRCPLRVAV